jgi:hypothetical protein
MELPVQFISNETMVFGERHSKLLDVNSTLVQFLEPIRSFIANRFDDVDCRPWHIELYNPRHDSHPTMEPQIVVLRRAQLLSQKCVDVANMDNYSFMFDKAFVLWTPTIEDFPTHTTIAYKRNGFSLTEKEQILRVVKLCSQQQNQKNENE